MTQYNGPTTNEIIKKLDQIWVDTRLYNSHLSSLIGSLAVEMKHVLALIPKTSPAEATIVYHKIMGHTPFRWTIYRGVIWIIDKGLPEPNNITFGMAKRPATQEEIIALVETLQASYGL